jgi:hypothetical protein
MDAPGKSIREEIGGGAESRESTVFSKADNPARIPRKKKALPGGRAAVCASRSVSEVTTTDYPW